MSRGRRSATSVLGRAVAAWSARAYDGKLDALLDLSGNGLHARLGNVVGADSNDPLRLSYRGCKEVYCPGSNNNGIISSGRTISTTTVSERVEISSVDLLAYVGADNCLIGNNSTHQQVRVQSTGVLRYTRYDTTKGTFRTADSTVVIPSDAKAVAAEYNGTTSVSFYYATTEDLATASWIQFGAAVAITAVATVQASWTPVVGHSTHLLSGTAGTGRVRQARWYRNAVLVDTFDAALLTEPYASYVDPVGGGTWTLTRSTSGRKLCVVDRDLLLLGTDDYLEVANSPLLNFGAGQAATIVMLYRGYGATFAANMTLFAKRNSISTSQADVGYCGRLFSAEANGYFILDDGTNVPNALRVIHSSGVVNMANFVRRAGTGKLVVASIGAFGNEQNDTTGSLTNTNTFRIGRASGAGTSYADMEFIGGAIFRSELTSDELIRLKGELLAL